MTKAQSKSSKEKLALAVEALERRRLLTGYTVSSTADRGPGSLRQALLDCNATPGPDVVKFNLPSGSRTIAITSALPEIAGPVYIDGASQPGYALENQVTLDGSVAPVDADGLVLHGDGSFVRGMTVTHFRHGIVVAAGSGDTIGDGYSGLIPGPAYNRIYLNRGDGIRVLAGDNHRLYNNLVYLNAGLAIDLGGDGLSPADLLDADAGPNGLANAPVMVDAFAAATNVISVRGSLRTQPGSSYSLTYYALPPLNSPDPPPIPLLLGGSSLNASPGSTESFFTFSENFGGPTSMLAGYRLAVVATDLSGNTGEQSFPIPFKFEPFVEVTNLNDTGPGSLRQAILDANATPGGDIISLNLVAQPVVAGVHHIRLNSPLPAVTDAVTIRGGDVYQVQIEPNSPGANWDGLVLESSRNVIRHLAITGFRHGVVVRGDLNQFGVERTSSSQPTDPPGDLLQIFGNTGDGIRVESGRGNQILGVSITGNAGLAVNLGADGPSPNDTLDVDMGPNDFLNAPELTQASADWQTVTLKGRLNGLPGSTQRVLVYYSDSAPGGAPQAQYFFTAFNLTTAADGTAVINKSFSLNTGLRAAPGSYFTAVAIGPDGNTSELSNAVAAPAPSLVVTTANPSGPGSLQDAINNAYYMPGADRVTFNIPGPVGPKRIVYDQYYSLAPLDRTVVDATTQPGYAGTPLIEYVATFASASYFSGLSLQGSGDLVTGMSIGGFGAAVSLGGEGNRVEACYLGLDASGNPIPNVSGVAVGGTRNIVGGLTPAARNVVSGNSSNGVLIGGTGNFVQGNYVGTDPTGTLRRPNAVGINVVGFQGTIGGTLARARNLISGNSGAGISLNYYLESGSTVALPTNNRVFGNVIGLDAAGQPLGNGGPGIQATAQADAIGGVRPGEGNVIAFNAGPGIQIKALASSAATGIRVSIRGNSVYNNAGLGIDLGDDGATPNDSLDADAGANALQNFPVLASPHADASGTTISGTLNSARGTRFTLDFYSSPGADPSGFGQGKVYLGSVTVTTDAAGAASFTAGFPASAAGQVVTATATDPAGNTSEFSPAVAVPALDGPTVVAASFVYHDGPPRLRFTFTRDVGASLSAADLLVQSSVGGAPAPQLTLAYDPATYTATFTFTAPLANGDYTARLLGAGIADASNRAMPGDYAFNFWSLPGDANRDRAVDFLDLALLAQSYNTYGGSYANGDFNGDGTVDFTDLAVMAQNYNTALPPPPPVPTSPLFVPATTAPSVPAVSTAATRPLAKDAIAKPAPLFSAKPIARKPAPPKPPPRRPAPRAGH